MTRFKVSEILDSSLLTLPLLLVADSQWNVLREVFDTSETEQEEGGILGSAAECLARIRSANASQTKAVLLERSSSRVVQRVPLADSHYIYIYISLQSACLHFDLGPEM